eukprot:TRINITY_DN921_c0_g1_i4.p1 TRINITY_DN921_c0_g1~~TRINITY_DN921_c0_g1_i4.p1  ORF type:complete len:129 (+),score=50.30 TRINITY_DN921_c0_g1_i4:124-510(+)
MCIRDSPWGGLTPVPPPRKYPEYSEEGLRELWMSLETRDFSWESFHRASIRCMPDDEREKVEPLFKDKDGNYKKRSPSMMDFINTVMKMDFIGQYEFGRQEEFHNFVRNVENRVALAEHVDGLGGYVG